ncbi:hypothetical protein ACNI0E_26310, partial [Escherichia coli]
MLPSETMIWQPEFTDKTLSRKPGAVHTPLGIFNLCFPKLSIGNSESSQLSVISGLATGSIAAHIG